MRWIAVAAITLLGTASAQTDDSAFLLLVKELGSPSSEQRLLAARELGATGDVRAIQVLEALVVGQLYVRRDDRGVVIGRRAGRGYELTDPLSGNPLGRAGRRDVSRIGLQSAERDAVRVVIVALKLGAGDAGARREARSDHHG